MGSRATPHFVDDGVIMMVDRDAMGECAEILIEQWTDGRRVKRGHKGVDVVGRDREDYQVKARTHRSAGRQLEFEDYEFNKLVVLLFSPDRLSILWAGCIDKKDLMRFVRRRKPRYSKTNHAYEIDITRSFKSCPGMHDVTLQLKELSVHDAYQQYYRECLKEAANGQV